MEGDFRIDLANLFNFENKKDLIKLQYNSYFQSDECRNLFKFSLIINSSENIWSITEETIEVLPVSKHEADTKLIFHAGINSQEAVIVAKDRPVFLLLIHALGQLECCLPHGI